MPCEFLKFIYYKSAAIEKTLIYSTYCHPWLNIVYAPAYVSRSNIMYNIIAIIEMYSATLDDAI